MRYLGRYTHRVGISNERIEHVCSREVRFHTKHGKRATLAPEELLRRFVMHVLPAGFVKIRHFGLLAPGNVHHRLERARALLLTRPSVAPSQPEARAPRTASELLLALLGIDVRACPRCHARAVVRVPLAETHGTSPPPVRRDTS